MNIKKLKLTVLRYHADLDYTKFNALLKKLGYLDNYYNSESVAFGWIADEPCETDIDNVLKNLGY